MSNETFTALPTVTNAILSDVIAAVQGGVSVQETLQQVINLGLSNTILNYAGNPNSHVAGVTYQLCWDTTHSVMYVCTTSGSAAAAVWTLAGSVGFPVAVTNGGTGLSSTTINQILYSSSNNVIAGLATTDNASLSTNASGVPTWLALTDGQIVVGSSIGAPAAATVTAGPGVSITNGHNTITISATASILGWNLASNSTQAMVADSAYVANAGGGVTFTLPTTAAFGTGLSIIGKGAGGWVIAQNALQSIQVGSVSSTVGTGGSVSSTNQFDSISLICTVANTTWTTYGGVQGNLSIV